jgi:hypothetical protein
MNIIKFAFHIAVLAVLTSPAASCAAILFSPSPATAIAGGSFTVDITASTVFDLYAIEFDVSWNPAVLQANSTMEGSFLPLAGATFFDGGSIDNTAGTISSLFDTLSSAIPGASGDGTIATLWFTALAPGDSTLYISNLLALDSSLNEISLDAPDGEVTISAGAATPEPSAWLLIGFALALGAIKRKSLARDGS